VTKRPKRAQARKGSTPVDTPATAPGDTTETPARASTTPEPPAATRAPDVPIVGIGASAGGLAAFEAFFSAMPADTEAGLAFVLVQHLAPDHKSILSDLVRRYTTMKVFDVEDGMRVEPHCAYIIPPNRDLALLNGTLHLLEPAAPRGLRLPIDFFFRSLAQDRHDRAIGIVLSGTGSDGTLGARAIKGEGGMVMAQTPASTDYDGMPRSVIATGLVDYVLPPAAMPAQLIAFATRRFSAASVPAAPPAPLTEATLTKIMMLLRARTGHDFSQYKPRTVIRRIERRMAVHQIESLTGYVRFMQETPAEADALFGDLLIGVTSFFRDADAFAALEEQVIAHLFDNKPAGSTIRVWVPGCSTGEEAYSIAMLLQERIQTLKRHVKVQLFATDVDRRAIGVARAGIYPASIAADISADRLSRFFVQDPPDGTYRIHKNLREMLIFSEQDVIKDPPFSRLDLISCRNMLIYMGPALQQKLIPLFHYALNPDGVLFLGTSETVGELGDLFAGMDRKAKLYRRKEGGAGITRPSLGNFLPPMMKGPAPRPSPRTRSDTAAHQRQVTEQALLEQGQIGALVDERGDILYLHGHSGHYLELAPGEAALNILKMAREGLRRDVTTALHEAVARRIPVRHLGVVVRTNGGFSKINLTVRPVEADLNAAAEPALFVVILEDVPTLDPASAQAVAAFVSGGGADGASTGNAGADARVAALTRELRAKEDYLQATNEELETSNEELKSSNDEMQFVNQELQSANEELETSKEELQSVNEELATVNAELQTKVSDLSRANNDMNNLLAGTGVGTVFVDHQLRVQRFTPATVQIINLIQTDLGRPLAHIASNLVGYDSLVPDIQAVLDLLTPQEVEVQTRVGAWFLLHIRPYRTLENVVEGAVITFTDITDMKRAQAALRDAETLRRLAVVVRDARDAMLVQGLDGRILAWNPAAVRTYGWTEAEALAMNVRALIPEDERETSLAKVHEVAREQAPAPYRTHRLTKDGEVIELWLTPAALVDELGELYGVATTERAIGRAEL
jgi:two-component system CheB/CheR fusion protein